MVLIYNACVFGKILIANRGEIAVRVMRACRELGVRTVAVYSEADAKALHVRVADEAVLIGPPAPRDSYLHGERLIEAARATGAGAIHPGYGFLSENADFAEAVQCAGLTFIGPSPDSIRTLGSKTGARALMQTAGVPVVPGFSLPPSPSHKGDGESPLPVSRQEMRAESNLTAFQQAASQIGYPVLVKAAGGGGGRGMRVVRDPSELPEALNSARREALGAFGDDSIFLEKYLDRAKHIEFQVFGDRHGHVVQLFERECSIQRRHQKLIEESPAPLLQQHPELRERMARAAVAAARAVHYHNAGTVEFIVNPDTLDFYFLEMNTRLQVEHPVTEALTGLDLVHWQLRVAAGERLPFTQAEVTARGHAVECRVTAEDPAQGFLPASGPVLLAVEPVGPGLRVDAGFRTGDEVSPHYDSLLAKVIAHAPTRAEALARMNAALADYRLLGVTTNIEFLRDVLRHPEFVAGAATTSFIQNHMHAWQPAPVSEAALIAAALHDQLASASKPMAGQPMSAADHSPWVRADGFRIGQGS
jgi:acetyl/propionyl-CoA carboxylase alpha subunit